MAKLEIQRCHELIGGVYDGVEVVIEGSPPEHRVAHFFTTTTGVGVEVVHHVYTLRRVMFPGGIAFEFYAHDSMSYGEARTHFEIRAMERLCDTELRKKTVHHVRGALRLIRQVRGLYGGSETLVRLDVSELDELWNGLLDVEWDLDGSNQVR